MLTRRDLFRRLAGAVVGAAAAPTLTALSPVVPVVPSDHTHDALRYLMPDLERVLRANVVFARHLHRDYDRRMFDKLTGDTVAIRLPVKYSVE